MLTIVNIANFAPVSVKDAYFVEALSSKENAIWYTISRDRFRKDLNWCAEIIEELYLRSLMND
jgi:hypothetical protein